MRQVRELGLELRGDRCADQEDCRRRQVHLLAHPVGQHGQHTRSRDHEDDQTEGYEVGHRQRADSQRYGVTGSRMTLAQRAYQLAWSGRPSSYPAADWMPTTARSWNSRRLRAPA